MGFYSWQDCIVKKDSLPFKGEKLSRFIDQIEQSRQALEKNDIEYLVNIMPKSEHWRILAEYYSDATYFDIETTGLNWMYSHVTVIAAYRKDKIYNFVYNKNLDDFLDLIDDSSLLVSFNGNSFDIPFLERTFHIPELGRPHIDLRWVSYHAGYKSGLKSIEKIMNIQRPSDLSEVNGLEAVLLYNKFTRGDMEAGDKLIRYCSADALSTYLVTLSILHKYGLAIPLPEYGDFSNLLRL